MGTKGLLALFVLGLTLSPDLGMVAQASPLLNGQFSDGLVGWDVVENGGSDSPGNVVVENGRLLSPRAMVSR